jgi:hypothetical protein
LTSDRRSSTWRSTVLETVRPEAARKRIRSHSTANSGKPELITDVADLRATEAEMRSWPNFQGFEAYFGVGSCSVASVEIAPLLAVQIHVLAEHARQPLESTGLAALVTRCLRTQVNLPPPTLAASANKITITHPDLNLRAGPFGGAVSQAGGIVAGAVLTGGPPWVQVMELGGRYYLRNGFHRAVQLGVLGVTHIPAVVIRTKDPSKLEMSGFPEAVMRQGNAPTLGHFVRGQATELDVYEFERVIEVSWSESQRRTR